MPGEGYNFVNRVDANDGPRPEAETTRVDAYGYSAEQVEAAGRMLEGSSLELAEVAPAGDDSPMAKLFEKQSADLAAKHAERDARLEKNAALMAKLVKDKLNADLDGNAAEAKRIQGMMDVLKERMNG